MFCSSCNAQLSDEAIYCPYCGTRVSFDVSEDKTEKTISFSNDDNGTDHVSVGVESNANQGDYMTETDTSKESLLPMGWFKFLIYFSLGAGAVGSIFTAISYFTGLVYISEDGTVIADVVYSVFPSLLPIDMICAVYYLAMAVFMVVTRFSLARFKRRGPGFVVSVYVAQAIFGVIYTVAVLFALEGSGIVDVSGIVDTSSTVLTFATNVVMAVVNRIYFKKRAALFVN